MTAQPAHAYIDAVLVYLAWCIQHGHAQTQPSSPLSTVGRQWVTLRDLAGDLARVNRVTGNVEIAEGRN